MPPSTHRLPALLRAAAVILAMTLACAALAPATSGCRALQPSNRPVDACVQRCKTHASRQCSEAECERGCEFILDRLVERETNNVIACVIRTPRRCTDVVWADCAVRIGVHADGGPPAPPPPSEDD